MGIERKPLPDWVMRNKAEDITPLNHFEVGLARQIKALGIRVAALEARLADTAGGTE